MKNLTSHSTLLAVILCVFILQAVVSQKISVPSYIYPTPGNSAWAAINAASGKVNIALLNPASGPGTASDYNYALQAASTRHAGIDVFGYVHTSYGAQTLDSVLQNVATYYSWYDIDGIFVDEASTDCSIVSYYVSIYDYVKTQYNGTVVINPGQETNECFMAACDIVMNAENSFSAYIQPYTPPSWVFEYPSSRFWHVIYSTAEYQASLAFSTAVSRNAGNIYITDDDLPNPYDTLPSYWELELSFLSNDTSNRVVICEAAQARLSQ